MVHRWSADFAAGEVTAITGRSGVGKSTILYLLGLMLRPAAGEVLLDGLGVSPLSDASRARLRADWFGFVFQDSALDAGRTVLDNVTESALYRATPRRAVTARAEELLDQLGVNVPLHRRPGQVSGGQAQRIALCRALLHNPMVVLADEPTGNLGSGDTARVIEVLRQQAGRGATVVVVTHSDRVAAACDRQLQI